VDTPFSQWNWLTSLGETTEGQKVAAEPGETPPLVLLSDRNGEIAKTYGVEPIEFGGAVYSSRATFVIDKKGILRYVNYQYRIREDYGPLLEVLSEL
jgi:peroxiredoxin